MKSILRKLGCLLLTLVVLFQFAACTDEYVDVKTYGNFFSDISTTPLLVFPEKIPQSAEVNQYYFGKDSTLLFDDYQLILDCTLSQEDFEKECGRLSSLNYTVNVGETGEQVNKEILLDTEHFNCESAYVAQYTDSEYEYALVYEGENRIVYVYLRYMPDEVAFDKNYLPTGEVDESTEYSMYSTSVTVQVEV